MLFFTRFKITVLILLVLFCSTVAHADSDWLIAGHGYRVDDCLPDESFEAYCMIDPNTAVICQAGDDMKVVDINSGNLVPPQSLGQPLDGYYSDPLNFDLAGRFCLYTSFITKSPTDDSYWIGFTNEDHNNDRVYQVAADGTWTYRATLSGNYDLKFLGNYPLVSANAGGIGAGNNQLILLDTSGNNDHTVLVELGGYSAGLGTGTEGDVYYATYSGSTSNTSLLQFTFTDEDIQAVIDGGAPYDVSDAEELYDTSLGAGDTEIDSDGHVLFNGSSFSASGYLHLLDKENPSELTTLVTCPAMVWLGNIEAAGDLLTPGSSACIATCNMVLDERGFSKITKLIPGDANEDGKVDSSDATILAGNWQNSSNVGWSDGDFNDDGMVDSSDATILAGNWQASFADFPSNTATAVPEPSMFVLLMTLALIGLGIRRVRTTAGR